MEKMSPPIPIEVDDLSNFARLSLAFSEGPQILWKMQYNGQTILALFTAYTFWSGDIPLLSFVKIEKSTKPFLAYKSDSEKGEEFFFSDHVEDVRFKYGSFIELKSIPPAFLKSIKKDYPKPPKPMVTELEDLKSIIRILFPISLKEGTLFPLWYFRKEGENMLGTLIPFEHYYEMDALPVFFYVKLDNPPDHFFIKYKSSKLKGEELSFSTNTSDAKYFYTKIISIKNMPFF